DLRAVQAALDQLERDTLDERRIVAFGEIDRTHAAAAQLGEQAVGADPQSQDRADGKRGEIGCRGERARFDNLSLPVVRRGEIADFYRESGGVGERLGEPELAPFGGQFEHAGKKLLDAAPAGGVHGRQAERARSRASQALASAHSRFTVAFEIPSASAVSSIVRPEKKRSSTSCACCGSNASSAESERSTTRTSIGRGAVAAATSSRSRT